MALIRRMVLACLSRNINFMAHHVPGRVNILADMRVCDHGCIHDFMLAAARAGHVRVNRLLC